MNFAFAFTPDLTFWQKGFPIGTGNGQKPRNPLSKGPNHLGWRVRGTDKARPCTMLRPAGSNRDSPHLKRAHQGTKPPDQVPHSASPYTIDTHFIDDDLAGPPCVAPRNSGNRLTESTCRTQMRRGWRKAFRTHRFDPDHPAAGKAQTGGRKGRAVPDSNP